MKTIKIYIQIYTSLLPLLSAMFLLLFLSSLLLSERVLVTILLLFSSLHSFFVNLPNSFRDFKSSFSNVCCSVSIFAAFFPLFMPSKNLSLLLCNAHILVRSVFLILFRSYYNKDIADLLLGFFHISPFLSIVYGS